MIASWKSIHKGYLQRKPRAFKGTPLLIITDFVVKVYSKISEDLIGSYHILRVLTDAGSLGQQYDENELLY